MANYSFMRLSVAAANERDKLIAGGLGLVLRLARRYARYGIVSFEDLYQEGVVGLLLAVSRFRPDHGATFNTFAYYWICGRMTRAIAKASRERGKMTPLFDENGEIREDVAQMVSPARPNVGAFNTRRWEFLMGRLTPLEREVIRRRFPADGGEPEPLTEIGKALGYTAERIRQIEKATLRKLRELWEAGAFQFLEIISTVTAEQ